MDERDNVIVVDNVKKSFKVFYDKGKSLKEAILFRRRRQYENREVLKGISFTVKKGEAIGLIGHNGCGKSTMLKLLTKIIYPDSGSINIKGRVSSLIELGAGFHPDMSGRENIYTNAAIFGLTKKEIDERISKIIDFSEIEEFIDNPVRTYSSGMYMRLAFSVAINVDADVLLIDEILGVGDANFQVKCFDKLREIKSKGTTIVIVSHSLSQIEQICDKCYWIDGGLIMESGVPKLVNEHYLSYMDNIRMKAASAAAAAKEAAPESPQKEALADSTCENVPVENDIPNYADPSAIRMGNRMVFFSYAELKNEKGEKTTVFKTGEYIICTVKYHSDHEGLLGNFGFGIFRDDSVHCYGTNISIEYDRFVEIKKDGEITVKIKNSLLPGNYSFDIAVHSPDGVFYDDIRRIQSFQVFSDKRDIGLTRLETEWFEDGQSFARKEQ